MPMLKNSRHELFAQALAAGKPADEAYQEAGFSANRGNASRLRTNENVVARIAELQGRVAEGLVITKQWILERLVENMNRAMQTDQGAVANRALELLGKEHGMFIDRKEVGAPGEFERLADDELFDAIREQAEEFGIDLPSANDTQH